MKKNLIIYWILTGLLCLWMTFQGVMFLIQTDTFVPMFEGLGMPTMLIVPLGVAKILASVAIISDKSALIKQAAYVGLGLDFVVALVSHLMVGDGNWPGAAVALLLLAGSYVYNKKR